MITRESCTITTGDGNQVNLSWFIQDKLNLSIVRSEDVRVIDICLSVKEADELIEKLQSFVRASLDTPG